MMEEVAINVEESRFLEQRHEFVDLALKDMKLAALGDVPDIRNKRPVPIAPVRINDLRQPSDEEKRELAEQYFGHAGAAYFILPDWADVPTSEHPVLAFARAVSDTLPLKHPVHHPMEGHPEAVKRFGPPDGTLKIYDLEVRDGTKGYREQAETAEMFAAHNDGLGYAGAVEAFIRCADSGPLWGGYTYFQNLVHLGLLLARDDPSAFASLFLPDAITALRPRGKGAISVTSPILFVNEWDQPQSFFRVDTGEYRMSFRKDCPPLERATKMLTTFAAPFAPGSHFVSLTHRGHGCIVRNGACIHGRTPFIDEHEAGRRRVLARKWFMTEAKQAKYKHVPGMHIKREYADIFPERFAPERLEGDWNWRPELGGNVRNSVPAHA
jgi:hypothetical protein